MTAPSLLEEDLAALLARRCDLCGREFGEDEEFYLLKRVALRRWRDAFAGEILSGAAMCLTQCGGQDVVKI